MCSQALLRLSVVVCFVETECVCRFCCEGVCMQALLRRSVVAGSVEMEYVHRLC